MRYPDGGGLTARGRSRREQVRLEAAQMFAQDADARQIARALRVSEGAWSVMKNSLGNLPPGTTDQLAAAMRHQLDRIQRRPGLITGFLGQTGLTLDPQPP
jgi:hypothetical protein